MKVSPERVVTVTVTATATATATVAVTATVTVTVDSMGGMGGLRKMDHLQEGTVLEEEMIEEDLGV
jgi:hypothetical protein